MRRTDAADALDRRVVIEVHAAAAVDLCVDEAGEQQCPLEIAYRGARDARIALGCDGADAAVLDEHGAAAHEARTREHPAVGERLHDQRVSMGTSSAAYRMRLRRCTSVPGARWDCTTCSFEAASGEPVNAALQLRLGEDPRVADRQIAGQPPSPPSLHSVDTAPIAAILRAPWCSAASGQAGAVRAAREISSVRKLTE